MQAIVQPGPYSFVNNPIYFELSDTSPEPLLVYVYVGDLTGSGITLTLYPIKISNTDYRFRFSIEDIFQSYVTEAFVDSDPVGVGANTTFLVLCRQYLRVGVIVPGGISKSNIKHLSQNNQNIFDLRFLNSLRQFLLTTRTNGAVIQMRRNEIDKVYYYSPVDEPILINYGSGTFTVPAQTVGVPVSVDLKSIIGADLDSVSEIKFNILGSNIFRIKLSDSYSENSLLLKFRNSLGVFETIELTGTAQWQPKVADDTSYNKYNPRIYDFEKARNREMTTHFLQIDTGFKSTEDFFFLLDLLSSDEIYCRIDEQLFQCLVTGTPKYDYRQLTPESMTVDVEFIDADSNVSPFIQLSELTRSVLTDLENDYILTSDSDLIYVQKK